MNTATGRKRRIRPVIWLPVLVVASVFAAWLFYPKARELPILAELRTPNADREYFVPWPLAFSPDGTTLAATKPGTGIALWDLTTRTIRAEFPLANFIHELTFDPKGKRFALSSLKTGPAVPWHLTIFDVSGREPSVSLEPEFYSTAEPRFSDDGSMFSLAGHREPPNAMKPEPWRIQDWEIANGKPREPRSLDKLPTDYRFSRFSRDHKLLAQSNPATSDVTLWDVDSAKIVGTLPGLATSLPNQNVSISGDSTRAAVCLSDGRIQLWDLDSRKPLTTLQGHSRNYIPLRVHFTADPKVLVSEGIKQLVNPSVLTRVTTLLARVATLGKSDGVDSEILVWDLRTGKVRARVAEEGRATISPDGKRMATCSRDRVIRVYDLSGP